MKTKSPANKSGKPPGLKTLLFALSTAAVLGMQLSRGYLRFHHRIERLERMWRASQSLNHVSQAIMATTSDLDLLLDTVESVAKTMRYDHAGVFLIEDGEEIRLYVGYGYFLNRSFNPKEARVQESLRSALMQSTRGYFIFGDNSEQRLVPNASWQVLYPLATKERTLGALFVACDRPPPYPEEAISLGRSLATLVAIGVQNIYLYMQKEEFAAAAERDRIARDIHDGIAQHLYMLSLTLESCLELADKEGTQSLRDRLDAALTLSRGALWESRQYLLDISPLSASHGSLKEAIYGLVRETSGINPVPLDFSSAGVEIELPVPVRTEIYRVVQEAIANAYKHAKATQISVRLDFEPTSVRVEVEDNGVGFSYLPKSEMSGVKVKDRNINAAPASRPPLETSAEGHGLRNMRRRMDDIGGSLEIITAPGQGVKIIATVPVGSTSSLQV